MTFQKALPVIASIGIILVVALLRDRSRAVAAVLATMPINIPLALWVVASGSEGDTTAIADFVRSLFAGLIPSIVWLAVVFLALRAEWGVLAAVGAAYGIWAALVAALFWTGVLSLPR